MDTRNPPVWRTPWPLLAYVCALAGIFLFFSPGLPRIGVSLFSGWWCVPIAALALLGIHLRSVGVAAAVAFSKYLRTSNLKIVLGVISIQTLFHLPVLLNPLARLNSDNAVTFLMIRHIVHSGSRPIHFFGQLYQGSLNAYYYSFFHLLGFSPPEAVALGNLVLGSVLLIMAIRLIRRLNNGAWIPVLLFLSLPMAAMYRLVQDRIRGISLVLIFMLYLADLSLRALRNGDFHAFRFGVTAGILFWCYQPAAIVIGIFMLILMGNRVLKSGPILRVSFPGLFFGFLMGVFPHLLAEINNGFINMKVAFTSVLTSMDPPLKMMGGALKLIFTFPGSGPVVAHSLQLLMLIALIGIAVRAFRHREWARLLLLGVAFISLAAFSLSGHPPDARYGIHYHIFAFFFLLAVAQFLAGVHWRKYPVFAILIVAGILIMMAARSIDLSLTLHGNHGRLQEGIQALNDSGPTIILGDYWDTVQLSPFVPGKILIPGLNLWAPGLIFAFSKYYPNALELGEAWGKAPISLLFPGDRSRFLEKNLQNFGISFKRVSRALPGATFYSDFNPQPSLRLLNSMTYAPGKSRSFAGLHYDRRELTAFADGLESPMVTARSLRVPGVAPFPGKPGFWSCVLESPQCRIRLPMGENPGSGEFHLPPQVGLAPGTYQVSFHYMDMPVSRKESIRIPTGAPIANGKFRFSHLYDRLLFILFQNRPPIGRYGIPCHDLSIRVLDRRMEAVDLEVISILNFSSTIWTRCFQQVIMVNGIPIRLNFGQNRIRIPLPADGILTLKSRHKSLTFARDSRKARAYFNCGILLKHLTPIYPSRTGRRVSPFLEMD